MENFDRTIKKRVQGEKWSIPESLDKKINSAVNSLPDKKINRKVTLKILIAAAVICSMTFTTVFAMNPSIVSNTINNIISFFNTNEDIKYKSVKENFEMYDSAIGLTAADKGIKLTIDNILTDGNFLFVFYTIEYDKPIPKTDEKGFEALFAAPFLYYKINGGFPGLSNNYDLDTYFESDCKLKGMNKIDISQNNIPDSFNLEIYTDKIFDTHGEWSVPAVIDKSKIAVNTKTFLLNQKAEVKLGDGVHDITIEKVSFSSLSNILLISEELIPERGLFNKFALFDDKGNNLQILTTGLCNTEKDARNTFEFIIDNKDTKYLTLVPIQEDESRDPELLEGINLDIKQLPETVQKSKYGSLIVDDIEFKKDQIKIIYHTEGVFYSPDPCFTFYDRDGNELEFGAGNLKRSLDRSNGRFTETIIYERDLYDFSMITQISVMPIREINLLYNQQIRIDLKK